MVVAISIFNVRVAPGPPTVLVNKQGASFSRLVCFYFASTRASAVGAISMFNARVAPGPPTVLVNKHGATFSQLFCLYFASTGHVWWR